MEYLPFVPRLLIDSLVLWLPIRLTDGLDIRNMIACCIMSTDLPTSITQLHLNIWTLSWLIGKRNGNQKYLQLKRLPVKFIRH